MWRTIIFPLIFWAALVVLFYTYFGYPLVIYILGKCRRKQDLSPAIDLPKVTVVLAASNEDQRIVSRLKNLLESDYPKQKLSIIVVSDASTDSTAAKAGSLGESCIQVIIQAQRSGKAACLNAGLAVATGEIIVFGDVRQRFTSTTISQLVSHFRNPQIGAVSGSLEIETAASAIGGGVDAYWKLEKFIRYFESLWDSSIGCTGAVYAIRRSLFRNLPADTVLDDVVIPMQIALQGYRVVFEPEAKAYDPQSLEPAREKVRKERTLAGNYQMMFRYSRWLLPWCNRLWWQLVSHKYLRLAAPWLMVLAFVSNGVLIHQPLYAMLFSAQCLFYILALLGSVVKGRKTIFLSIPAGFVFLNLTAMRGLWHYFCRPSQPGWQSAPVTAEQKKYV